MLARRLVLTVLAIPAFTLVALGALLAPPGLTVALPVVVAVLVFTLVVARAGPAGPHTRQPWAGYGPPSGVEDSEPESESAVRRRGGRVALAAAGVTAAGVLVVAGLVAVAGPATGPILLLAGLAAAAAAGWAWWGRRPHPDRSGTRRAAGPADSGSTAEARDEAGTVIGPRAAFAGPSGPPAPDALSTRALCAAWQRSYFELRQAQDGRTRDEIAALRRCCLDELARRDPAGLARWFADDPRPAGADPHRHFATDTTTGQPARHRSSRDHPSRYRPDLPRARRFTRPHPPEVGPSSSQEPAP